MTRDGGNGAGKTKILELNDNLSQFVVMDTDILATNYTLLPKTKLDAERQHSRFYFTGEACIYGHKAPRYTRGGCVVCVREKAQISGPKSRAKKKAESKALREATTKECKRKQCTAIFSPKTRMSQIYCSQRCADIAGRYAWRDRNRNKFRESENRRKQAKYANDPEYRSRKLKAANEAFHNLSADEKTERSRKNREQRDPEIIKEYHRNYHSERSKIDIDFRLANSLRARVRAAITANNGSKAYRTMELVGCTIEELKDHLEQQFQPGMSWENYGDWHVDHIKPVSSFKNLGTDEDVQRQCFHFQNLQPLWASENLKKSNKSSS